nr:PREDICTED: uncharacterized protein LOC107127822 isoform X1 [Macaca fascicularis]
MSHGAWSRTVICVNHFYLSYHFENSCHLQPMVFKNPSHCLEFGGDDDESPCIRDGTWEEKKLIVGLFSLSMGTAGKSRREDGRYQKWSAKKHLIISAILRRHTEDAIGGPAYPARRSPIRGSVKPAVSFPSTPRSLFAEDGKGAPGICLSQGDGKAADLEILEIGKNKTICLGRQRESWSHPGERPESCFPAWHPVLYSFPRGEMGQVLGFHKPIKGML